MDGSSEKVVHIFPVETFRLLVPFTRSSLFTPVPGARMEHAVLPVRNFPTGLTGKQPKKPDFGNKSYQNLSSVCRLKRCQAGIWIFIKCQINVFNIVPAACTLPVNCKSRCTCFSVSFLFATNKTVFILWSLAPRLAPFLIRSSRHSIWADRAAACAGVPWSECLTGNQRRVTLLLPKIELKNVFLDLFNVILPNLYY